MKIYLLFLILICFFFTSCETEFSNTYVIKNTSSHVVYLTGFDRLGDFDNINDTSLMYSETYTISPNTELKKVKQAGYHSDEQGIFDSSTIDSITIIFDSLRIITFACNQPNGISCTGKYNLMNYEVNFEKKLTGKSSGKEEYTYTFYISDSDYDNAESIK